LPDADRPNGRRLGLALAALGAGALVPLSLAPFGFWPLGMLAVAVWFWVLRQPDIRPWLAGWLFGVGKYAVGASWIYVSIHVYGDAPPLLAGFLVALFVAGLGLFTLANAVAFAQVRGAGVVADALCFAVLYVVFEWVRTWFLTGFPWLLLGYAHLETPLSGLAPVGGMLLVSLVVALTGTLLVVLVELRRARPGAQVDEAQVDEWPAAHRLVRGYLPVALLLVLPWLVGFAAAGITWVAPLERHTVALVQGNVDQSVKWDPEESQRIIDTYVSLSEPHWDAQALIWPEAAITLLEHEAASLLAALDSRGHAAGAAVLVGLPRVERLPGGGLEFHNAARVLGTGSGLYLKRRLVPFGEYVPLEGWLRGLIAFFDLPMSGFTPGAWAQPLLDLGGPRGVMAICYEVVYPDLVREQADRADVLLTISNDTWFGASAGPWQHLEMAQMRALENGRWMLRGTNNGITAIIDHHGRIRARLPQFEAGVLRGEWWAMQGTTPYTRLGYLPVSGSALVLLALAFAVRRRHP
jgi:apolipoprotein N-acyltransferase